MLKLDEVEYIFQNFRTKTLPIEKWTHQAHLIVAYKFLYDFEYNEAICYLRSGIIAYNYVVGTENSPRKGYHETLTLFWAKVCKAHIDNNQNHSFLENLQDFLESKWTSRDLTLQYYSSEKLFTTHARAVWIEPDIKAFDF